MIVRDRYAPARRELERAHDYRALALRAELHLRTGDLARAEADARPAERDRDHVTARRGADRAR
jgi:hypothetical protein